MFKSQLQEFAQKAGLLPPVYEFTREGPSHEPRFKATVTVEDVKYESPPGFTSLKKAEHAAAKAALEALSKTSNGSGVIPSPVHESGLCKNLLQEYAQKCSLPLPVYRTERTGEVHIPSFNSTVEIAGVVYKGGAAKNKKDAEVKAAKTALLSIHAESHGQSHAAVKLRTTASEQDNVVDKTYSGLNADLEHLGGKKRARSCESHPAEPLAGKLKVETVKEEKIESMDLPLSGGKQDISHASTAVDGLTALDSMPLADIKPAFLGQTSATVEIPGLEMGCQPKLQQEAQQSIQEQGQKMSDSQLKEEQHQAFASQDSTPVGISVGSA